MASAAHKAETRRASSIRLPNGDTADDRRVQIGPNFITPIHIVTTNEGGECVNEEIGELPVGTKELYVQHRMAGDFYCFIHAKRQVAATGDTAEQAFKNALRLAA